ncbi:serine carboxypeptidase-like 50 [Silene latifolia]|uniref:serine carboxypeptidase-like 50 n=1 Tax=Silene latifolia TaxID=37657 RepID=UPI003D78A146
MKSQFQIFTIFLLSISTLLINLPTISSSTIPTEAIPTKSGYLKVNSTSGSSIFYTFYEAKQPISSLAKTPLLIWLQGGPGCSSMIGNFFELGPWRVNRSLELEPNLYSWNRLFGLVFFDNPIGTGFSIAAEPEEIPRNQRRVSQHLYIALKAFIRLDKKLFGRRPVYITGESYAGKYGPAFGYYIVRRNAWVRKKNRINLHGVAVGNGLTDPESQVKIHGLNAYYSGLINDNQRSQLEAEQKNVVELIEDEKWGEATNARNKVLRMLQNMTGLATLYDVRRKTPYETELVEQFLRDEEVRKALAVNKKSKVFEECSDEVGNALHEDVMKSVKYKLEYLLKKRVKVLLYQGGDDLRDGVVSVEAYLKKLKWVGLKEFGSSERRVWNVRGEVAGYVQKWGSLSEVVVLGAGHLVPYDQGLNSQVMIEDWVLGRGFFVDDKIELSYSEMIVS